MLEIGEKIVLDFNIDAMFMLNNYRKLKSKWRIYIHLSFGGIYFIFKSEFLQIFN